ncbi:hypothetical protein [Burkholderia sp. Ac-20365]|uniref:hypothetical protein n=1 Tax=Burkholderia sp. Ac-20365 TaxID=2703897 RepID=UPI00197B75E6|nr:hypothetical protein [Burkholderia sp. Ac-20365]MBN3761073.1 hypothetical protein [Burkholderia sp. Ac-20365]
MGFAIFPIVVVMFFAGITMQLMQSANGVVGASVAEHIQNKAIVSALEAEAFSTSCLNAALSSPGMVSANITVVLPNGVPTPPNAVCMSTSAPGGGRNVYSYLPAVPGEFGRIGADSGMSELWLRGLGQGQAASIASGQSVTVPTNIPTGTVIQQVLVNP